MVILKNILIDVDNQYSTSFHLDILFLIHTFVA